MSAHDEERARIPDASGIRMLLDSARQALRARDLLNGRELPLAAARAAEGPQLGGLLRRLAALDQRPAVAIDGAVDEREAHGGGGVIAVAFAPGLGEIALLEMDVADAVDDTA